MPLVNILLTALNIVKYVVLIQVIMSWLVNFQVLNLRQPLVAQIWHGLSRLLDPLYSRVRKVVPSTAGIDFAPLIVLFAIFAAEQFITYYARYL